jgi:hypothetical protein
VILYCLFYSNFYQILYELVEEKKRVPRDIDVVPSTLYETKDGSVGRLYEHKDCRDTSTGRVDEEMVYEKTLPFKVPYRL